MKVKIQYIGTMSYIKNNDTDPIVFKNVVVSDTLSAAIAMTMYMEKPEENFSPYVFSSMIIEG